MIKEVKETPSAMSHDEKIEYMNSLQKAKDLPPLTSTVLGRYLESCEGVKRLVNARDELFARIEQEKGKTIALSELLFEMKSE